MEEKTTHFMNLMGCYGGFMGYNGVHELSAMI
jgi:hypothetical protein